MNNKIVQAQFKNAPESLIVNVLCEKSIEKATLTAAQSDLAKDVLNRPLIESVFITFHEFQYTHSTERVK